MMSCPVCQTNLDDVPVGSPCPKCGSLRRDATITPETIAAVAHVFAPAAIVRQAPGKSVVVSHGVDAFIVRAGVDEAVWDQTWRRAEELATRGTVVKFIFHDPGEGGVVLCEALDENDKLLDAKPGRDPLDAMLNVADALFPPEPKGDEGSS